jgi:putative RecB family exonuclease
VPLERPPHLSPSSLDTFLQCPLRYKLSRIEGLQEPPSADSLVGNFVHSTLEDLFKLPHKQRTKDAFKALLRNQWETEYRERAEAIVPESEINDFRWRAIWAMENYFAIEDPTIITPGDDEHDGIETEINPTEVQVAGVPIKGFIDRWDLDGEKIKVTDYKTGKTPQPRFQPQKYRQLLIYADALQTMVGREASEINLLFIKDGTRLQQQVTPVTLRSMRDTVKQAWDGITERCETGDFETKVGPLCGWCAFKPICPEFNNVE